MSESGATDVLIVGGGVIGLAIGWRALREGMSVTLLEREPTAASQTSRVAAGLIAPIGEASASEPALLQLGLASAGLYSEFIAELEAETGSQTGYRRCGTLLVARDGDEAAELDRALKFRRSLGSSVNRLLPAEARRLEPSLARTLTLALEVPEDHTIDPRALAAALSRAFTRAGGDLRLASEVSGLGVSHRQVNGVRLDNGETLSAGHVVIAAGPWSGQIGGMPPRAQIVFRPVKGQILTLADPLGPGRLERVLRMPAGYLVPRGDGRYVLGASTEERGFDQTITAGAVHELLRGATEIVPAVAEWMLEELNAGIRPGTSDNLPVIGASPTLERLVWAAGHHRHGILLTPITAELVVAELAGHSVADVGHAASPARFADLSARVDLAGPVEVNR
jgi:glycine oxidase